MFVLPAGLGSTLDLSPAFWSTLLIWLLNFDRITYVHFVLRNTMCVSTTSPCTVSLLGCAVNWCCASQHRLCAFCAQEHKVASNRLWWCALQLGATTAGSRQSSQAHRQAVLPVSRSSGASFQLARHALTSCAAYINATVRTATCMF